MRDFVCQQEEEHDFDTPSEIDERDDGAIWYLSIGEDD
jgi:hypothetical protein